MSPDPVAKAGKEMAASSMAAYRDPFQRGALRCGMGDAALLCDVVAREALAKHTEPDSGRITAEGERIAQTARDCGDAIWAMRAEVVAS